jgi:hypothetical protein
MCNKRSYQILCVKNGHTISIFNMVIYNPNHYHYNLLVMILTPLQREVRSQRSGLPDNLRIRDCSPGRDPGSKTMPLPVRALIGTLANLELDTNAQPTTNKELAAAFDIHPNQVSSAKHGKIGAREDDELKKKIDKDLGTVRDVAMEKTLLAIGLIDNKALERCKAPDLARVAASMAGIVERTLPKAKDEGTGKNNVRVLIHNMGQHQEDFYAVVEVEN